MIPFLIFVRIHMIGVMGLAAAPLCTFLILRVVHHRRIINELKLFPLPVRDQDSLPGWTGSGKEEHEHCLLIPGASGGGSLNNKSAWFDDDGYDIDADADDQDNPEEDEDADDPEEADDSDYVELGTDHLFPFKKSHYH